VLICSDTTKVTVARASSLADMQYHVLDANELKLLMRFMSKCSAITFWRLA
jgi:hypothetical protein